MPSIINATVTSGLTANSDVSGNLIFQTSSNNVLTLDRSQNATFAGNVSIRSSGGTYIDVVNGLAKAWVNFNGISGSVAVRSAFNVSSITYNGTGDYTVNFTTSMANINYSAIACASGDTTTWTTAIGMYTANGGTQETPTTSSFRFITTRAGGIITDKTYVLVSVFGS